MPAAQIVRIAGIGGRRQRSAGVGQVLDVEEEAELIVHPHAQVQVGVDERADIALVVHVAALHDGRHRVLARQVDHAVDRGDLIGRDLLDPTHIIGRRGDREVVHLQRVLPVATDARRTATRRELVRPKRTGIFLHHARRGHQIEAKHAGDVEAADQARAIGQLESGIGLNVDARADLIVGVDVRHVEHQQTGQRVRVVGIRRIDDVALIARAHRRQRGATGGRVGLSVIGRNCLGAERAADDQVRLLDVVIVDGQVEPVHRLEDRADGEAARHFGQDIGIAGRSAADAVGARIGAVARMRGDEAGGRREGREARIAAGRVVFREGRCAEALRIGRTQRELLDRGELGAHLRREVAIALRIVVVTARDVQIEAPQERRVDLEEPGGHGLTTLCRRRV